MSHTPLAKSIMERNMDTSILAAAPVPIPKTPIAIPIPVSVSSLPTREISSLLNTNLVTDDSNQDNKTIHSAQEALIASGYQLHQVQPARK